MGIKDNFKLRTKIIKWKLKEQNTCFVTELKTDET